MMKNVVRISLLLIPIALACSGRRRTPQNSQVARQPIPGEREPLTKRLKPACLAAVTAAFVLTIVGVTQADTIGYWRMEEDTRVGNAAYHIPNEFAGGETLRGAFGEVHPNVPFDTVPGTGAANTGTLGPHTNPSLHPDVSGWVPYYAALDVGSVTVEFFVRTDENFVLQLFGRWAGGLGLEIGVIDTLRLQYTTASGTVKMSDLFTFDGEWEHVAFTYDQASGVGKLFVSGELMAMNDGPDGEALIWPSGEGIHVARTLAGGTLGRTGLFDELRISDRALDTTEFLAPFVTIPEPTSAALLGVGSLALLRRRRRMNRA